MAEAAWDHTAEMLAMMINTTRDPKKSSAAESASLNPFRQQRRNYVPMGELKRLIVGKKGS